MQVQVQDVAPGEAQADVLALTLTEGGAPKKISADVDELLRRLVSEGELGGELGTARLVHVDGKRIAVAGIGPADEVDADILRTAAAAVVEETGRFAESITWTLDDSLQVPAEEQARAVVEGTVLGAYDPARWKRDEGKAKLAQLTVLGNSSLDDVVARATRISEWVNRARDLVNSPPNETNPERLAARAAEIASELEHVDANALGPDEIREQGMGAFAAVAKGSENEPRLIVLRYEPPNPIHSDLVLGLVGKAITFDTGGVSLQPAPHLQGIKGDKGGGGGRGGGGRANAPPWP